MSNGTRRSTESRPIVNCVDTTSDTLTGRAGLAVFLRYIREAQVVRLLDRCFGSMRKTAKGRPVAEIFEQLMGFFLDGTSFHLVRFDALKQDEGYAATIGSEPKGMLSSHSVKRFFKGFSWLRIYGFRRVLRELFLWRLLLEKPAVIILGIDTMVMDNDEAEKRHGVSPTYKKVKGFQPLHLTWGRFLIDAVFRGGKKHSNHGKTVQKMIEHVVASIRDRYRKDIPIVIRMDSGFFDQKIFKFCEKLGVGYICGGKLYKGIVEYVRDLDESAWDVYSRPEQEWRFVEFGDSRGSWSLFRRALFCQPLYEDEQRLLEFARPDTVLYTNLGMGGVLDDQLRETGEADLITPEGLLGCYHGRGADELIHRVLKDFGPEALPFKRFLPNAAFYYTMLVALFLFETFKEDVAFPVIPLVARPETIRRVLFDVAGKIVSHSGVITLKVTQSAWNQIRLPELWKHSAAPPRLSFG
jgi:hypothetical protein